MLRTYVCYSLEIQLSKRYKNGKQSKYFQECECVCRVVNARKSVVKSIVYFVNESLFE